MHLSRLATLLLLLATPLGAQPATRVQHEVAIGDPASRMLEVTSRYTGLTQDSLDLALPVWTPGWYTLENYARNIHRLEITDRDGRQLSWRVTGKSAWRVSTRDVDEVRVRFAYLAPRLGLNQAKVADDWAFFTGSQLFLEPVGHRDWPASVRFSVPSGWRVLSSLQDGRDSLEFLALDYDQLADATTQLGHFDARRFEVVGKRHWFIATPMGALSHAQLDTMVDHATRIVRAQAAVFGDSLPYQKYLFHYFYLPSETNTGGGLEHASSHVSIVGPLEGASPTTRDGLLAHEYFHLWNVKRLRPAELWPYDYGREVSTPSLWLSEGFTNYYASLGLLRAGLSGHDAILAHVSSAIASVEGSEARPSISIADASASTWLSYGTSQPFGLDYYAGGEMVAALLDLAILHASAGSSRLDDFMRTLWRATGSRGRGFTRDDVEQSLTRVASPAVAALLRRLVDQREAPPYDSLLAFAGYRLERIDRRLPALGMIRRTTPDGDEIVSITPGGAADRARLRVGDIVQTVNGRPIASVGLRELIGSTAHFGVLRRAERMEVTFDVPGRSAPIFTIVELEATTAAQRTLRERWLGP